MVAPIDLPPFDNAAVDGYAVRAGDVASAGETRLPLGGRVPAGHAPVDPGPGFAVRIFTGAPMPPGTDAVAMQEDVRIDGEAVILPRGPRPGSNRRRAGEDMRRGSLRDPGRNPARAAPPRARRRARPARPAPARAATSGVVLHRRRADPPGRPLPAAGIHDANRPMLAALLRRLGAEPADLGILRDAPGPLRQRLEAAAADHDLILTTGGVSVGEEDHVRAAVEASGGLTFWRLAIKPGRPVALGTVAGTPFAGLPGNPAAAYVTALAVLRPLVLHLSGARDEAPTLTVRSGFAQEKRVGRREYLRVQIRVGADGVAEAVPSTGGRLVRPVGQRRAGGTRRGSERDPCGRSVAIPGARGLG